MDFTPITTNTLHMDTPTRPAKGSVKRHLPQLPMAVSASSSYKECLKNHAASIGGHALDGCGEFMLSPTSTAADPRSLICAVCGCHRNFHRRDPQEHPIPNSAPNFLNCFHSAPPLQLAPRGLSTSTSPSPSPSLSPSPMSSPSPPPLSHFPPSSYRSAACTVAVPHMLLALGTSYSGPSDEQHRGLNLTASMMAKAEKENPSGKKRCRTKFSREQKERMCLFSEKLGWKMQKGDDGLIQEFCNEIGVSRGVFKVWMHNNKNTFRMKRSEIGNNTGSDHEKVNIGDGEFDSDINKNPFINSIDIDRSNDEEGGCAS